MANCPHISHESGKRRTANVFLYSTIAGTAFSLYRFFPVVEILFLNAVQILQEHIYSIDRSYSRSISQRIYNRINPSILHRIYACQSRVVNKCGNRFLICHGAYMYGENSFRIGCNDFFISPSCLTQRLCTKLSCNIAGSGLCMINIILAFPLLGNQNTLRIFSFRSSFSFFYACLDLINNRLCLSFFIVNDAQVADISILIFQGLIVLPFLL